MLKFAKGGKGKSPTRTPDSLYTTDTVEVLIGVSEGPIKGPRNGPKDFYLDDTPLVGQSGEPNFASFQLEFYEGEETGHTLKMDLGGLSSPITINTTLASGVPVTRSGVIAGIDAADFRVVIGQLFKSNDDGTFKDTMRLKFEVKKVSDSTWSPAWIADVSDDFTAPSAGQTSWQQFGSDDQVVSFPGDVQGQVQNGMPTAPPADPNDEAVSVDPTNNTLYRWNTGSQSWGTDADVPAQSTSTYRVLASGKRLYHASSQTPPNGARVGDFWLKNLLFVYIWNGSAWVTPKEFKKNGPKPPSVVTNGIWEINEKVSSATPKDMRVFLNGSPTDKWMFRVTKLSPDSTTENFSVVTWESVQEIKRDPMTFTGLAMWHVVGRASDQFTALPNWSSDCDGRIVKVPSNYDPVARTYAGVWDGTYKLAYTNNTAWIFQDFVENTRYGLSRIFPHVTNRWKIYEWAQFCDQPVQRPDGTYRPRFTYNDYVTEPRDAQEMAQYIAGAGGARYVDDGNGVVEVVIDRDNPAVAIFTRENVSDEGFSFTYTDRLTRANEVTVEFTNPNLNWQRDKRIVRDDADIAVYGRIPDNFIAVACTDEDEAISRARARLITNLTETEIVSFETNRKGRFLAIWDTILIADPTLGRGLSGRIKARPTTTTVTLRDAITLEPGFTYKITFDIVNPAYPATSSQPYVTVQRTITNAAGTYTTLTVNSALPTLATNAAFVIEAATVAGFPKPYRITGIEDAGGDGEMIRITALEINRNKFAYIDTGVDLGDIAYSTISSEVLPPTNPRITTSIRQKGIVATRVLRLDWDRSPSPWARTYRVFHSIDGAPANSVEPKENYLEVEGADTGVHTFAIVAVDVRGRESTPVTISHNVTGEARPVPGPSNLTLVGGLTSTTFNTPDAVFKWDAAPADPNFQNYVLAISDATTNVVVRTEDVGQGLNYRYNFQSNKLDGSGTPRRTFKAQVWAVDRYGNLSPSVSLTVSNAAPAAPVVTITPILDSLQIVLGAPTDRDVKLARVWVSSTNGFNPAGVAPTQEGNQQSFNIPVSGSGTRYIRAAYVDEFDGTLNYSAQQSVSLVSTIADLQTDVNELFDVFGDTTAASASAAAAAQSAINSANSATAAAASAGTAGVKANDATNAATAAATSATNAATSYTNAQTQATNAANSASTASTQATNASTSATNALASKNAAALSASGAATSETNAAASAATATTKANDASTAASNASTSATNALASQNAAALSASGAATSSTNAATNATNAANSASAASSSASNASTSATNALASANAAALSKTGADTALSNATTQASNALTSANAAASSATAAATSATNAAGSSTAASGYATNASNSANAAAGSASAAAGSATAAASSYGAANLVAASLFPDRYDGAGQYFSATGTGAGGSPASLSDLPSNATATGYGPVREVTVTSGTADVAHKGVIPVVAGRIYKVEVEFQRTAFSGTPNAATQVRAAFRTLDASYASVSPGQVASGLPADGSVQTTSWMVSDVASSGISAWGASAVYLRPYARVEVGGATSVTVQVRRITVSDVTEQQAAATSAAAAATSATSAATSATNAGSSASAAQTSATNASTSAGNAATSASNASTYATQASGSASTATTQAGNASTSAGAAATSATNAANSATAASGSANTASTAATSAGNSASAAATSATNASSSFTAANLVAAQLFPDRYDGTGQYFSNSGTGGGGSPASLADLPSNANVAGYGPVREVTITSGSYDVAHRGVLPAVAGRVYKVEVEFQRTALSGTPNSSTAVFAVVRTLDASYASVSPNQIGASATTDGTVQTVSAMFSDTAGSGISAWGASAVYLRPYARVQLGGATSITAQIRRITVSDVTEQQQALASANAAATSASNAATSATAAGTSATAAQTSATNASTSASNASTSATQASNAASTATTQASNASTSAGAAATSATNASNSATAAGNSATAAATSATNAGNSATAANTSAVNAASAYDAAHTSELAAASSASAAATSASNASTSATNAASSATSAQTSATNAATQANAAGSASSASTSATNASNSASTATTQAAAAGTSATNAATSATNAANSATAASGSASSANTAATNAGNSASAAAGSATSAASSFTAANLVAAALFPDRYDGAGQYFTAANAGDPVSVVDAPSNATAAGYGPVRALTATSGNVTDLATRAVLPAVAGRTYRAEVELQRMALTGTADSATGFRVVARILDSAYASLGQIGSSVQAFDGTVQKFSYMFSDTASSGVAPWTGSTVYLRPYVRVEAGGATSITAQVRRITVTDVTEQQAALASANAAATSASNAATSATAAGTSATAAQTSATNASTSAGAAATSASNASTSATNASNSASTATTQAANAATSASAAATSATNAGNSATAANTSAGQAATYATNAGNSATAASQSAVSAQSVANRLLPDRPAARWDFITAYNTGAVTPDAAPDMSSFGTVVNVAGEGDVLQQTTNTVIVTRGWMGVGTGQTFRSTVRAAMVTDLASGTGDLRSGFVAYAADGTYLGVVTGFWITDDTTWTVPEGWRTFTHTVTSEQILAVWPTAAYVRAAYGPTNLIGSTVQVSILRLENITSEAAALSSAAAAATAASNASTSATAASTSATAAQTSATNASTSAGAASTSAGNASTSATNAATSASTATTQANNAATSASQAATSATNAGNSATAAAGSASAASTSATNAGNSATAASASAVSASSSFGSANLIAAALFPDRYDGVGQYFISSNAGAPASAADLPSNTTVSGYGPVYAATVTTAVFDFATRAVLPATPGKIFKIEAEFQRTALTGTADGATGVRVSMRGLNDTYGSLGAAATTLTALTGSVQTLSFLVSDTASSGVVAWTSGSIYLRPYVRVEPGSVTSMTVQIRRLTVSDVTQAQAALSSANAAATSASNAATSATNAGNSASAASTSATNAATQATNAAGSASAASTSATNASNSASTATTQASNASTSAGAAATSATNAANSATAAGTSATNAATSATNAGNSATAAAASAVSASSSFNAANLVAATLFPDRYDGIGQYFTASTGGGGSPAIVADLASNTTAASYGPVYQAVVSGTTGDFATRGVLPCVTGRIYRVEVELQRTAISGTADATTGFRVVARPLDDGYTSLGQVGSGLVALTGSVQTFSYLFSDTAGSGQAAWGASAVYLRPYARVERGGATSVTVQFRRLTVTDVTEQQAAASSAAAAATSASNATTQATNAGTSASAASTSATNASTQATNAANSASAASTSATNASNSATTATTQAANAATSAGAAATSATNAANSATAAAGSATTASTQATNAGNSATAAAASQVSAASSYSGALLTAAMLLPQDFQQDGQFWFSGNTGSPATRTPLAADSVYSFVPVAGVGQVAQISVISGTTRDIGAIGAISVVSGRRYRLTARARVTTAGGSATFALFAAGLDSGYAYQSAGSTSLVSATLAQNAWTDLTLDRLADTVISGGCAYLRPMVRLNAAATNTYQVQFIKLEDVTESYNASTSATAAATSASSAATQATNAGNSASAAATSATQAGTSATNASTSASNASTSATQASNAASTATTQASNASTSAGAASTSATNAANSATAAAGSATAASTSATNAGNSATAAAASATQASSSYDAAALQAAASYPDRYGAAALPFTATYTTGDPTATTALASNASAASYGPVYEMVVTGSSTNVGLRNVIAAVAGRTYKVEAEFQRTALSGTADSGTTFQIGMRRFDGTYADSGVTGLNTGVTFTGAVQTTSQLWSDTASSGVLSWGSGVVWLRPYVRVNRGGATSITVQLRRLTLTDVTATLAAQSSANAAAQSASDASTSAGAAGSSATAASGSATSAGTSATNAANSASAASTSASQASTSASTATTQASNASTSAGSASTSATNAANSATAAAGSATAAGTSATNAGNSASAAAASATQASSSFTAANLVAAALFPDRYDGTGQYFTNSTGGGGSPASVPNLASNATAAGYGPVYQADAATSAVFDFATRAVLPAITGKIYRVEVELQRTALTGTANSATGFSVVARTYDSNYASISPHQVGSSVQAFDGTVQKFSYMFSDTSGTGIAAWGASTVYLRPYVRVAGGGATSVTAQIRRLTIKDVTSEMAAASSASAASTSASAANTSATAAGTSAGAAATSATTASTQAGNASVSATNAASSATAAGNSATDAATSASTATSMANLSASVAGGGSYNKNPTFQDWTGSLPANWATSGGVTAAKNTTTPRYGNWALRTTSTATASSWITTSSASELRLPTETSFVVVEYEITLVSGDFRRAGIVYRNYYNGGTTNSKNAIVDFWTAYGNGTAGKVYRDAALVPISTSGGSPTGDPTSSGLWLASNWPTLAGGADSACVIDWHRVVVRAPTSIELETATARGSYADISSRLTTMASDTAALATTVTSHTSSIGSLNASVTTISSAVTDLNTQKSIASFEVQASASGGLPAFLRLLSTTGGGYAALVAPVLALYNSASGGSVVKALEIVNGLAYFANPINIETGGKRLTLGPGFGTSGDLLMWFGPSSVLMADSTVDNCIFAINTSARVYYQGAPLPGYSVSGSATSLMTGAVDGSWKTHGMTTIANVPNNSRIDFSTTINKAGISSSGGIAVADWVVTERVGAGPETNVPGLSGTMNLQYGFTPNSISVSGYGVNKGNVTYTFKIRRNASSSGTISGAGGDQITGSYGYVCIAGG